MNIKKRIECPVCRVKLDPQLKPAQLSKNYIAADLAGKQREIQKKLLFCNNHKEPLRFYCESCQEQICANCIIEHNGHKFLKQEHSVPLLKERTSNLKVKLTGKMEDIQKMKANTEVAKTRFMTVRDENIKLIDEEFDKLIQRLNDRRQTLKANYQKLCTEELEVMEKDITKQVSVLKTMETSLTELNKLNENLNKAKVIQGDEVIRPLNDIEDDVSRDVKLAATLKSMNSFSIPSISFDRMCYNEIVNIGITSRDHKNPRVCFFGEKNKVLHYNIEKNEWKLSYLPIHGQPGEFHYYSSACTLPSGDILITGGGVSNSVYMFSISKMSLTPKKHLLNTRKEHASIFLNNCVYVLGGYDGTNSRFLNSCEQYDLEKDEWKSVSPMVIAKCAFGATTVSNRYIYTVGGYDGQERLNTIERYDYKTDKWTLLDVQLKNALSNSACVSIAENTLVILGGGFNLGFSLDMNLLDTQKNEWVQLPSMTDGRDLRNKIVFSSGCIYAIGGNNCKGEKYSVQKNEWSTITGYEFLVKDNLDSWACAQTFDLPGRLGDPNKSQLYQNYQQYDEMYDVDDDEEFGEHMSLEPDSFIHDEWEQR
jgi:kelch-like protein 10